MAKNNDIDVVIGEPARAPGSVRLVDLTDVLLTRGVMTPSTPGTYYRARPLAADAEQCDQFEHGVKRGFQRFGVTFDLREEQATL